jgi:hypothetical protein
MEVGCDMVWIGVNTIGDELRRSLLFVNTGGISIKAPLDVKARRPTKGLAVVAVGARNPGDEARNETGYMRAAGAVSVAVGETE